MNYLSYWLLFVAFLRSISVVLGYISPVYFQQQIFTQSPQQVTPLAARTFAIWTLLTCSLCLIAAFHLHERGAYLAVCFSFYAALAYFMVELLVFHTVSPTGWTTLVSLFIAGQLQRGAGTGEQHGAVCSRCLLTHRLTCTVCAALCVLLL